MEEITNIEIIKMLNSIRKDAEKLHAGNVAHQRVHIIANIQWLIDELSVLAEKQTSKPDKALDLLGVSPCYLLQKPCEIYYGAYTPIAVFDSNEDAEKYAKEHFSTEYSIDGINYYKGYSINEAHSNKG